MEAAADFASMGQLETRLARVLERYPNVVEAAAEELAPHSVAQYSLDRQSFNSRPAAVYCAKLNQITVARR